MEVGVGLEGTAGHAVRSVLRSLHDHAFKAGLDTPSEGSWDAFTDALQTACDMLAHVGMEVDGPGSPKAGMWPHNQQLAYPLINSSSR